MIKRISYYQEFKKATEKELLLHAKIYVNDWKEENFDIVFGFENTLNPDLCIFLYQEVYRAMRGEVLAEAQAEVEKMQLKCCDVFQQLKTLATHKFLCRLDELFLSYNQVSMNRAIFDQQDTAMLLNFIEKFRSAEKNINSKILSAKEIATQFLEKFPLNETSKEDFAWLVVLSVVALPAAEVLGAKENWTKMVEGMSIDVYKKLQSENLELVVKSTPIKVLPWKTLEALNSEVANKFWQLWKAKYVLNQYPKVEVQDDGIVLTGKSYQDEDGEYPEAIVLYLAGLHFEPIFVEKKSSLERNAMTLQQKNFKVAGAVSSALGVQFSFIVDKCILNSRHKKKFSM